MHVSLRQVQIFEAVAGALSYTRAAEELHLTQPLSLPRSSNWKQHRIAASWSVSASAVPDRCRSRTLATCRDILGGLERLEMRLNYLQGLKRCRLRVAMVTTAKYLVPCCSASLCVQYPASRRR